MSEFLGRIHYLLYSKIQLQENILEDILNYTKKRNIPVNSIISNIYNEFGYPERGILEEVISNENIHGWLQSKIQSVESRTAALINELKNNYGLKIEEIAKIYYENGKTSMEKLEKYDYSPEEMYILIFNHLLEGMPCDRINEVTSSRENEFIWKTTRCIHREYWDCVNGDVSDFYFLKDSWIKGFLSAGDVKYSYIRSQDGYNIIRKEK